MTEAQDTIERGLEALRATAPPGADLAMVAAAPGAASVPGDGGGTPAPGAAAPSPAAAQQLAPGWLVDYVALGLDLAVEAAAPPGISDEQHRRLIELRPHERALIDRIEGKLPPMPEMDLKTLLLLGGVVIVVPRARAVIKLRRAAQQAPTRAPAGPARSVAADPAPAATVSAGAT